MTQQDQAVLVAEALTHLQGALDLLDRAELSVEAANVDHVIYTLQQGSAGR